MNFPFDISHFPLLEGVGPEQALLLCCARAALEPQHHQCIEGLLAGDLSWELLYREAAYHNLIPLAHHHLSHFQFPISPWWRQWQAEAAGCQLASLGQSAELLALLPLFRREGICAAVIKGPVAALTLYGALGLRPFEDLDILVRRSQVRPACRLLERHGYAPLFPLRRGFRDVLIRTCHENLFRRAASGALVDLHWGLLPRGYSFSPPAEELWPNLEGVSLGGTVVPTLGPEDTLLFYCLHGAKHGWSSLHWVSDLAELVRRRVGLDWDRVCSWAGARGAWRLIQIGLRLARQLLDAPVPPEVLARGQRDRKVTALADHAAESLLHPPRRPAPQRPWPWTSLFYQGLERASDRWHYWHTMILAPGPLEWQCLPLPAALAPLYYGVRPVRLITKMLREAISVSRSATGT
jgi:hypothetical protein